MIACLPRIRSHHRLGVRLLLSLRTCPALPKRISSVTMNRINSINVDVWIYNIFPYLLSSDQYKLSRACCVKVAHAAPDAPAAPGSDGSAATTSQATNTLATMPTSLQSYLSIPQILSRAQKHIVANFHASSLNAARHFQAAEEFNFTSGDISLEQKVKDAVKTNGSNFQSLVKDEMQPKSRTTEPLALNTAHLFTKGIHWGCLSGRAPENEYEESYCSFFYPDSFKQLKCGLILPTKTYETLATNLTESASSSQSDESCSSSSPSSASVVSSTDAAALASLRILGPFEAAVQRLLPIQRALVSMNAQWHYLNGPNSPDYDMWNERVGGFHITPFVVPWPTSAKEFIEAMREFETTYVSADGTDQNQFAVFGDEPAADLSQAKKTCGGESYPTEAPPAYHVHNGWICSHECADNHSWSCGIGYCVCCQESPRVHRACLCHAQVLRGCIWWHCERATHWVRRLILKRMGVDIAAQGAGRGVALRARVRPDWGEFFAVNPASPQATLHELPDRESFQPIDPSSYANRLLQEAMPWSIDISGPLEICTPALGLVAAPLSNGWVGGFLATTITEM